MDLRNTHRDLSVASKDEAWRELEEIDRRLERGEIDEPGWHQAVAALVVPAYLAARTPWQGSGKSRSVDDWEYARSHLADAIDRPGSFLDVGCANGYLLECLPRWTAHRLDRFGLDIAPETEPRVAYRLLWIDTTPEQDAGTAAFYIDSR